MSVALVQMAIVSLLSGKAGISSRFVKVGVAPSGHAVIQVDEEEKFYCHICRALTGN